MKLKLKYKKYILGPLALLFVLLILLSTTACLPFIEGSSKESGDNKPSTEEIDAQDNTQREVLETRLARRLELEIDGESYPYKRELINILLLGTDFVKDASSIKGVAGSAGQSDFMLLLSIDPEEETVLPIQIDRDTLAEIKSLNILGRETGLIETQICRAHNYGSSPETGAELASWAVSRLFHGIKIDHYISVSIEDVAPIVDYLGGVELTLEEDLRQIDESFYEGHETARLSLSL